MTQNNIPFELSDYALAEYFHETGVKQGWLSEGNIGRVLIAVSGGGDSIALLWLFRKFYPGEVFVVHVNHGIRGQESDGDAEFVKRFADNVIVKRVSVPNERLKGESLESAARRIRLNEICVTAKSINCDTVMLGHNRDDLAETVLFNLLRGTGIRGGVGITECTELDGIKFYRPLLGLRREFLRDILRVRNISWREDSTNSDANYTRNYIRLELLPLIEKNINSSAIEHLANFGEDMRLVREHEDRISAELFRQSQENAPGIILKRKILRTFNENQITLIIREAGRRLKLKTLSRTRCNELAGLILGNTGFIFQWSRGVTITSRNGKIIFNDERRRNNDERTAE